MQFFIHLEKNKVATVKFGYEVSCLARAILQSPAAALTPSQQAGFITNVFLLKNNIEIRGKVEFINLISPVLVNLNFQAEAPQEKRIAIHRFSKVSGSPNPLRLIPG